MVILSGCHRCVYPHEFSDWGDKCISSEENHQIIKKLEKGDLPFEIEIKF